MFSSCLIHFRFSGIRVCICFIFCIFALPFWHGLLKSILHNVLCQFLHPSHSASSSSAEIQPHHHITPSFPDNRISQHQFFEESNYIKHIVWTVKATKAASNQSEGICIVQINMQIECSVWIYKIDDDNKSNNNGCYKQYKMSMKWSKICRELESFFFPLSDFWIATKSGEELWRFLQWKENRCKHFDTTWYQNYVKNSFPCKALSDLSLCCTKIGWAFPSTLLMLLLPFDICFSSRTQR